MLRATIQVGLAAAIIFAAIILGLEVTSNTGLLCHNIMTFAMVLLGAGIVHQVVIGRFDDQG